MSILIIIAIVSIIALLVLHELGHFVLAKKFGVKVEEFGIGYPPRIIGKKFGETLYSLNWLPFGAFVKVYGETERNTQNPRSFTAKPIWQRALILAGGVLMFWLIAVVLLSIVFGMGKVPVAIDDTTTSPTAEVQVLAIAADSPAEAASISFGDSITKMQSGQEEIHITTVGAVRAFAEKYKGQEILLTLERGSEMREVSLTVRDTWPANEGPMGVQIQRVDFRSYPWYEAPVRGVVETSRITVMVVQSWGQALSRLFQGQETGVQVVGPVGIFGLFVDFGELGAIYFLRFVALISIYMALINLLPIPVADGGKLALLALEKLRGKPVSQRLEQRMDAVVFTLLLILMIWVTILDVTRLL